MKAEELNYDRSGQAGITVYLHPLPVRMGAKHSVTLNMSGEPPLPLRMGAKHSVTLSMVGEPHCL